MKIQSLVLVAALCLGTVACTDAERERTWNYGNASRVTCHSGGVITFDDFSTGRVEKHGESDGFYFVSATTGRLSEVTGDCIVDYGAMPGPDFKAVRQ